MRKDGIAVSVEELGLSLSEDKPYLGASLDRVVTMIGTGKKWGVEINKIFACK